VRTLAGPGYGFDDPIGITVAGARAWIADYGNPSGGDNGAVSELAIG